MVNTCTTHMRRHETVHHTTSKRVVFLSARRKPGGVVGWMTLLAGMLLLLASAPGARADRNPPGCTGSGLGINLYTSLPDVHIGDTLYYSVMVFNSPFPACDAGETNTADAGAIRAWVVTPDGITNFLSLRRTFLVPGDSDYYTNVVSYVVRAQDIRPDGTLRAIAVDEGDIHQNVVDSRGGGNQGVNTQVNTPCVRITAQCSGGVGENGAITFSGTVTNCGNVMLFGITVTNFVNNGAFRVFFATNLDVGQAITFTGSWIPLDPCGPSTATLTVAGTDVLTASPQTVTSSTTIACQDTLTPGIKVTKECPPLPTPPGQPVTFSGSVSNTGNVTLTNIVVVGDQPAPNTPVFTLGSLPPGAVANFTGNYPAPTNCSVAHTLSATATSRCGVAVSSIVSGTCPILTTPRITVTASCPATPVVPGGPLAYSGTVRNSGDITLTNVVVVSDRPAADTIVFTAPALAPGASASFISNLTVPTNACSVTTTFTGRGQDICSLVLVTNSIATTCPVTTAPAIAVTLLCPSTPGTAGALITYSGTVRNSGNVTLNNVVVVNSQAVPNTVLNVPSLAPGASANFTASFTAPSDACSVSSTVTAIGSDNCTAILVTNTASATCPLVTTPRIVLTQLCPSGPAIPGVLLTYSGTVSNAGDITLTNVVIVNNLSGSTPVFTHAALAAGAAANFTGSFLAPTNCSVTSISTATGRSVCGVLVSNTVSTTCPILSAPAIVATLACPGTPIVPGGPVTYTGTVRNSGNAPLNNVNVVQGGEPTPPPTAGQVGYWSFNESSGSVAIDGSGHGNDGQLINATRVVGEVGNALAFNGTNAYVDIPNNPSLNFAGPITMAAWIYPQAIDEYREVLAHGYTLSPTNYVFLRISHGSYQAGAFNGGGQPILTVAVPPTDLGTWVHLAGTFDGTTWRLYRNGALIGSTSAGVASMTVNANWAVGARGGGGDRFFKGMIDEARLYNRALSASEIAVLAGKGNQVLFSAATLAAGASGAFTLSAVAGGCSATAEIVATGQDSCSGETVTNTASATCPVSTAPAIVVTLACPTVPAVGGGLITYTGSVRNSGNITLNNVEVVNSQVGAAPVLKVPSLAPGQSADFAASFAAPSGLCSVTSMVIATGSDSCSEALVTNTASATCPLVTTPRIVLRQDCPGGAAVAGGMLTYSGSVSNAGDITLTNIVVVNNLSGTAPVFTLAALAPGAVAPFTGSFLTPSGCSVTSVSTVTGRSLCGGVVTNTVSSTCPILTAPAIAVTQNCPSNSVLPGGILTYSGTVSNAGLITLSNVVVVNNRPAPNTVILTRASLAPRATANFTGSYQVPTNCCTVWSTVQARGQGCEGIIVSATETRTCPVLTVPKIVVTKNCTSGALRVGDLLTYSGTVSNAGNITLIEVTVTNDRSSNSLPVLGPISLAPGESANYYAAYIVPPDFCGTDTVKASGLDMCTFLPVVHSVTTTCPVTTAPAIVVTKNCPPQPTPRGGIFTFTGSVSNAGDVTLLNVTVEDNYQLDCFTRTNGPVLGPITLAPRAVVEFTNSYTAPLSCCEVMDTVTAHGQDRCSGSNVTDTATTVCPLLTTPSIALGQDCPGSPIPVGSLYFFSGYVTNTGDAVLTNVVVFSPEGSSTPALGPIDLAPGESEFYFGSYAVPLGSRSVLITALGWDICGGNQVTSTASCPVAPGSVIAGQAGIIDGRFSVSFPSETGKSYTVQYTDSLGVPYWIELKTVAGTGSQLRITDEINSQATMRFYRIIAAP